MTALGDKSKLRIGQFGYSLNKIASAARGPCYFDGIRYDVLAGGDIRKWSEVIVITLTPEPTVIETWSVFPLSYELTGGGYLSVGEGSPLPITAAGIYDDYKAIAFSSTEEKYIIGTAAHGAKSSLPASFEAKSLLLYATQDCWVRFNESLNVQHFIPNGVYFSIPRRVTVLYVVRTTLDGTLRVWAFG